MMTRDEIIKEYEAAVAAHAAAAATGLKGAGKSYELFKAGLDALRPVSRGQVEKVWRAHWNESTHFGGFVYCSRCGYNALEANNYTFCPKCGSPFTDEAVQMVMERLEALKDAGD